MKTSRQSRTLRDFVACERGNALLDFGLIAAMIATAIIGLLQYATMAGQATKLSNAARAAVERAMDDPADLAGIKNVAIRSGDIVPETLTVTANQFCECPGAGTVLCSDTCADGSLSNMYVTVNVSQPAERFFQESGTEPELTLERSATMRMR